MTNVDVLVYAGMTLNDYSHLTLPPTAQTNVGVAIASVLSVLVIMLLIALAILIIYWYKKRSRR